VTPELILILASVFGAVALGAGLIGTYALGQWAPERRRLERAAHVQTSGVLLDAPTLTEEASKFAKQVTSVVPRSPKEMTRLRRRLVRAGYQDMTAVGVYTLAQLVTPLVFGLLPLLYGPFGTVWPAMLVFALVGWFIPSFILDYITGRRQKVIRNGLPDALDLLIVCLESGSGMDQAILRVSEELELAYPPLAEELKMLVTETRAGKPRLEAFRNFSSRTGVDDVRALVAMLVQTDRFGTSVSQALRTHAEVSRTKRRQRAEEKAAKIGVKLVFPLVFCLFPAFFVVTLGPAVVRFVRVFFGQVVGE